jgi:aryl-alcohol dehydrogenase
MHMSGVGPGPAVRVSAAVVRETGRPFEIETLGLVPPRSGEVLVRIHAAGICHTDLAVRDQHLSFPLPAVLGHEGAGVVEQTGPGVTTVVVGARVVLSFAYCGRCGECTRGLPSYCRDAGRLNFGGVRRDGSQSLLQGEGLVHGSYFGQSSFATYAVVHESSVVNVGDGDDLLSLGPLGCSVLTGAGTVMNALRPPPGSRIAVFGTGAVGLSAVMAARLAGCARIVGVDVNRQRRNLADELGATHSFDALGDDLVENIRAATGGGVDFAIDTTGLSDVVGTAMRVLAPLGTCALLATSPGDGSRLDLSRMVFGGRQVRGVSLGNSRPQELVPILIELNRQGRFPFERLIRRYPLAQINDAVADSESGRTVKPVLVMPGIER